jgi:hypothetical protein
MLRDQWVEYCLGFSGERADLYSGCRKILRGRVMIFNSIDESLRLEDAGFTKYKMNFLKRAYLHEESLRVAVDLWGRRRVQDKYGSVGVTCYNHFIKSEKTSKRASVMGPCIQSVVVTYIDRRTYALDMFYRTTELLKKFPADLVFLRDMLLPPFDFSGMQLSDVRCHFANVTVHPMYFVTILPHLERPVEELEVLRQRDLYFYNWVLKWTARYICPEFHRGIAKFAQALRVHKDANARLTPEALAELQDYVRANHPPFTRCRFDEVPAELRGAASEDAEEGDQE